MKLTSIIILLCGLQLPILHSQSSKYRFGVNMQARISDLVFYHTSNAAFQAFVREGATWRLSPGISPWVRYDVSERLGFQAGLGYELSGYRAKEFVLNQSTPQMPEPVRVGTAKGTIHYHDLNLSFYTQVKPFRKAQKFYLFAGLSNLVKLSRRQTIIIHFDSGETVKRNESIEGHGRKFNTWNLRSDIGFGFDLNKGGKITWCVEPVFGYTLFPVSTEGAGKWQQFVAGVNIGIGL